MSCNQNCSWLWYYLFKDSLPTNNYIPPPASYPDVSLSMCAQGKAGRRKRARRRFARRLYPSHGPLRFITSHSRFALASAMRKEKGLRTRLYHPFLKEKLACCHSLRKQPTFGDATISFPEK